MCNYLSQSTAAFSNVRYAPSINFPFSAESKYIDKKFARILREIVPDPTIY